MNEEDTKDGLRSRIALLERENRKLRRTISHLNDAVVQEKLASLTALNHYKASTLLQRERERSLSLLLANSPSIIFFVNQGNRVEFCTDYFAALAGFTSVEEAQGHTVEDLLAPFMDAETHGELLGHIHNVLYIHEPLTFDARFRFDPDSAARDFSGLLVPMKDKEGRNNGLMLMFHDVTDLKQSREEALAASKAKTAFLSNMSHEIRTPMNAIIGMTSIGKQEKSPERKNYAFEKIEMASSHLLGVINDILDISKIESGKMELSPIPFSFPQMLDRVFSVTTQRIQEAQQNFSVSVDPAIPEKVVGDDQRLAQVITNILSNATKFTPKGGSISFAANLMFEEQDSCFIQMSVTDSGIGMSDEEQAKLFNIFQQAQAGTARKFGGSGLGLAISKRILELMGGDIQLDSAPGKGTTFFFTARLGLPTEEGSHAALMEDVEQEPEGGYDFSGKSILVVDDVPVNLEIVAALLESTGLSIDTAENGREAVAAVAAQPDRYDLILMDVQMPEIDGLQATQMIRSMRISRALSLPIVAMTANVFREDIQQCLDAGMDAHLGKPVVLKEVLSVLAKYLKKR